jgi:hypothetical protein
MTGGIGGALRKLGFLLSVLTVSVSLRAAVSMDSVTSVTVSTMGFLNASIALDNRNNVHMVYVDTTTQILKHAKLPNGTTSWVISDVSNKKVAAQSDLAMSPGGTLHAVYYQTDSPSGVKHSWLAGSTWVSDSIEDFVSTNTFVSIAVGSDNIPRVVYSQTVSQTTQYSEQVGTVWISSTVMIAPCGPVALALDDTNAPRFLSVVDDSGNRYVIYVFRTNSGVFLGELLATVPSPLFKSQKIGLAIDKGQKAHMSYYDESVGGLMYSVFNGDSLSSVPLDGSPGAGYFSDIAVNDRNEPMVLYSSMDVGVRSAVLGTSWTLSTVESGTLNGVGPTLVFNRYHHYLAGYLNANTNELKFVTDAPRNLSVSGTVLDFVGSSIPGVVLTLSGGIDSTPLTVSPSGGGYSADHLFEGSYTLTPSKADYAFVPKSIAFNPLTSSLAGQNFKGGLVDFGTVGNLFNPATGEHVTFNYSIIPGRVSLKVYSLNGTPIRTLVDQEESGGNHSVPWDGRDMNGHVVASGIYLVTFEADQTKSTTKVAVVK